MSRAFAFLLDDFQVESRKKKTPSSFFLLSLNWNERNTKTKPPLVKIDHNNNKRERFSKDLLHFLIDVGYFFKARWKAKGEMNFQRSGVRKEEQVHENKNELIILIDADDFHAERSLNALLSFFFAGGMRWTNECHNSYRASAFLFLISNSTKKSFPPFRIFSSAFSSSSGWRGVHE